VSAAAVVAAAATAVRVAAAAAVWPTAMAYLSLLEARILLLWVIMERMEYIPLERRVETEGRQPLMGRQF
jgi:hypothetical protein